MGIPQCIISEFPDTQVIIALAYTKLTEYFWKFQLHCGNFVRMPYSSEMDRSMVCQYIIDTQGDIIDLHNIHV